MSWDCSCDYDAPAFYNKAIRRARKEHKCCECGGRILPGDQYEHVAGVWEGNFDTFMTCERCHDIWMWTKNNVPCLCWAHGNRIEDCKETIFGGPNNTETVGLRFGFLRRIVSRDRFNRARSPFNNSKQ
jgi:hypothetical protein